jgi:protein arginine N-methyltransferase 5
VRCLTIISFYLQALRQELAYASYLNVQSAILPAPRNRDHVASYARIVNASLKHTPYIHLSIRLPIYNPSVLSPNPTASPSAMVSSLTSESLSPMPSTPRLIVPESSSEMISAAREEELNKTWEMWDLIRSICDYDTRLTLSESRILLFGGGHQIHVFSP